jgi:hypothetical protein
MVWQQVVDSGSYTWEEAKVHCAGLMLAGGGWRLPTAAELYSLVVYGFPLLHPAIDQTAFPNTPQEPFWSATDFAPGGGFASAWMVDFYGGSDKIQLYINPYRVRCVR